MTLSVVPNSLTEVNYKGLKTVQPLDDGKSLRLTFKSPFAPEWHWDTDKVSISQIVDWATSRNIQDAMPHLDSTEREFFVSGFSRNEQDEFYG